MKLFRTCLLLIAICELSSCRSNQESLTYFKDIESINVSAVADYRVKIQPADELMITVTSTVPEATAPYNMPLVNPAKTQELLSSAQQRMLTYMVDSKGDITFPELGVVHVAGMTVEQLQEYLTKRISEDVTDPIVRVELVNFVVNVAGEVKEPGRVEVKSPRFSVLDALTAVGDMTTYGKRENVLVVREENGTRTFARLNLNNAETLNSPYFYLKQNDYVYVEPTEVRKDNADYNQNNSFKISVVSAIVSACSVVSSLVIALTR